MRTDALLRIARNTWMEAAVGGFEARQPTRTLPPGLTIVMRCRNAFLEWRKCDKVRAQLDGLSDRELLDIGIARGEIDYVVSNRANDPRGGVFPP